MMNKRERKEKARISSSSFFQTILLSECPQKEHDRCRIRYSSNNTRSMELCMCPCHEHARPSSIRELEPILRIRALNDIH
jgi:hypothetical protein